MPGDSPMTLPQLSRAPLIGLAYATGHPQRHLSSGRPAALHSELKGRFAASQAVWWQSGSGLVLVWGRSHVEVLRSFRWNAKAPSAPAPLLSDFGDALGRLWGSVRVASG